MSDIIEKTDEKIYIKDVNRLLGNRHFNKICIPNLRWLIPLCMDNYRATAGYDYPIKVKCELGDEG
jgi:hypothetical protein